MCWSRARRRREVGPRPVRVPTSQIASSRWPSSRATRQGTGRCGGSPPPDGRLLTAGRVDPHFDVAGVAESPGIQSRWHRSTTAAIIDPMAPRRVKMMWDYTAFPLWRVRGDDGPWHDELPISDDLRSELQAWSDDWTDAMWGDHGPGQPGWKPPSEERFSAWDQWGRDLLRRVRNDLGSQFEVGYRSERSREVEWPGSA